MKKIITVPLILIFVLVSAIALFGAGTKEEVGETQPYKGVKIVFAAQPTPTLNLLHDFLPEFEEMTGIDVTFDLMPYESLVQKVTLDTTAGTKQYACF